MTRKTRHMVLVITADRSSIRYRYVECNFFYRRLEVFRFHLMSYFAWVVFSSFLMTFSAAWEDGSHLPSQYGPSPSYGHNTRQQLDTLHSTRARKWNGAHSSIVFISHRPLLPVWQSNQRLLLSSSPALQRDAIRHLLFINRDIHLHETKSPSKSETRVQNTNAKQQTCFKSLEVKESLLVRTKVKDTSSHNGKTASFTHTGTCNLAIHKSIHDEARVSSPFSFRCETTLFASTVCLFCTRYIKKQEMARRRLDPTPGANFDRSIKE